MGTGQYCVIDPITIKVTMEHFHFIDIQTNWLDFMIIGHIHACIKLHTWKQAAAEVCIPVFDDLLLKL